MILVLGGTTEGRKAADVIDKGGKTFYYSTKGEQQEIFSKNVVRLTGAFDCESMTEFCRDKGIGLIVDASHPFAAVLHSTAGEVGKTLNIPVVRFERKYPPYDSGIIWCENFEDAVEKLIKGNVNRLLALTGVQTIASIQGYWQGHECFFRILNREESLSKVKAAGFPLGNILFYENEIDISGIVRELGPDAILTKESGDSGGFSEKVGAALNEGIKVYAVKRPKIPEGFEIVTGEYGLRKAIERILPSFFPLHSGYTTGSCATAAAKAALLALLTNEESLDMVSFKIPNGEEMRLGVDKINIIDSKTAEAVVTKNAGDDPDITDGQKIIVKVRLAGHGDIHFFGGEGIGTVTLPGVGLAIGEPAINPVPRQMIRNELLPICPSGCDVTISIPGGERLAKQTFNPRIGIEGGMSIIGTSGIVMPFSHEAFMETISCEMEVAKAIGCERVVLNSGARSEKAVKTFYPDLPPAAFIHYGNAIGESLEIASKIQIKRITVGVMLGKAVKLAEGNVDTHSKMVVMNRIFIAGMAQESGCSPDAVNMISRLNMARELWSQFSPADAALFFPLLLLKCRQVCRKYYPAGELTMMLITDSGDVFCENTDNND